jgi:hypothetical protein
MKASFSTETKIGMLLTQLDWKASASLVALLATSEKLAQFEQVKWYDETLSHATNKLRMKEVGASAMHYRAWLAESTIMALAKVIEDIAIDLKIGFRAKLDVWKLDVSIENLKDARLVRAFANVIKHNQSTVESSASEHARFLVRECGIKDHVPLWYFTIGRDAAIEPCRLTFATYYFCLAAIEHLIGFRHAFLDLPNTEREEAMLEHLVPEVLGLWSVYRHARLSQ